MTDKYTTYGKTELRAACKDAGISYSKLTNEGMRDALRGFDAANAVVASKPTIQLDDNDQRQLTHEAEMRAVAPHADDDDSDIPDDQLPAELLAAEDEFEMSVEELARQAGRDPRDGNCPGCGIHLSNGLLTPDDEAANMGGKTLYETGQLNREFQCMGCNHQWGKEYPPHVAPVKAAAKSSRATGIGIQIERNRETRNGVTRPSAGGKCRAVWDMLDEIGTIATAKQAREGAATRGYDKTTTMVQFYR